MNLEPSCKNKNQIIRGYIIAFSCVNSIIISVIILIMLKGNVDVLKLIIFVCISLLPSNILLTFLYFKKVRSLDSKKNYYDLDKNDRKKLMMSALILLVGTVLGVFLLFVNGMMWVGIGILIVSAYTYLCSHMKLLKN